VSCPIASIFCAWKIASRALQRLLRPFRFRHVTGDLGESDDPAVLIADRLDPHMCPEAGAVLAHPPCFDLEPPLLHGGFQGPLRLPPLTIFSCIEQGKMPTDDVFGGVARDSLSANVPVGDVAVAVEQADRLVGDALHQQLELALALPQPRLGLPPLGQVAGDLGEAHQPTVSIPDWVDDDVRPEAAAILAHPPAFAFKRAIPRRGLQRPLRQSRPPIGLGVEDREMLAQDLGFLVALEAACPGVPACDIALGVEHVDRVVGDRLDQQPVAAVLR
jgi:hypothetical protein